MLRVDGAERWSLWSDTIRTGALSITVGAVVWAAVAPAVNARAVWYIHTDGLGSVVLVTDQNRNVIERREYEPNGNVLNRPASDGPGYIGHVEDAATGLTYMQQRYYDSLVGRFVSTDPVAATSATPLQASTGAGMGVTVKPL